jgi:hypothetical protein
MCIFATFVSPCGDINHTSDAKAGKKGETRGSRRERRAVGQSGRVWITGESQKVEGITE